MLIRGAGGGGGGSSSSGVAEAPDSLRSKSFAKIVDLLGEGEMDEVCVGGLTGCFLNDVPVQNPDGTFNYQEVTLETRTGTLNQSRMNVAGTTEASFAVNVEMKYNSPVEKVVSGTSIDYLRVVVAVPRLTSTSASSGDTSGTSVNYKIEYHSADDPVWRLVPITGSRVDYTFLTYSGSAVTGFSSYKLTVKINPTRIFETKESYVPCQYTFQYSVNGGGYWITMSRDVVYFNKTVPFQIETAQIDSVLFRVLVEDVPTFSHNGTVLQPCSSQIVNLYGGNPSGQSGVQTISGKTTSVYEKEHAFRVTGDAPFTVRCTRITPDSTSSLLENKTIFQAVSVVTEEKFVYPGSALVGISFDATQFNSIPSRSYLCKMRRVKVPTNYDPITREYNGFWNGSFKIAWTDNPAWCFYDLITDPRSGLGDRIPESYVDAAALYEIAQYCDEWVPDGVGGFEPRYTCNILLQTREEAYKVVSDMASIFRGISYWAGGSIIPVQDSPKQKRYAFTNTNVIDGTFTYQGSSLNSRFNAVSVTWNDPANYYKQSVEYVQDEDAILSMGFLNHTTLTAIGCTSKSMARRVGKWLLYTNNYETEAVTFSTGMEGVIPFPGDIISISDNLKSNERMGGRVVNYTPGSLTMDAPLELSSDVNYSVVCVDADGNLLEASFVGTGATTATLPITFSASPVKDSIFVISSLSTAPESLFRVLSVVEKDKFVYEISAATYYEGKYDAIELDERLTIPSQVVEFLKPVQDIVVTETAYSDGVSVKSKARFEWTNPAKAAYYDILLVYPDDTVVPYTQKQNYLELLDPPLGDYVITVTAKDVLGNKAVPRREEITLVGLAYPPAPVENLAIKAINSIGYATWNSHSDLDVRVGGSIVIKYTTKLVGASWEDGIVVAQCTGGQTQVNVPIFTGTYMAKAVDTSGVYSIVTAFADSRFAEAQATNVMATLLEHPTFSGVKTNLSVQSNTLVLSGAVTVDDVLDWDSQLSVDNLTYSQYNGKTGTYVFHDVIDLTGVYNVRVYGTVGGFASILGDTINSRLTPVNTWERFNGGSVSDASMRLQISLTDDDPYGVSPVWGEWADFILGDYVARGFRFRLVMNVTSTDHLLYCNELSVSVDAVDRTTGVDNVSVGTGGFSVSFDGAFATTPAIAISIDNMQDGDYYAITNRSPAGFTAQILNNGNPVARQIDWIATGYGRKTH